MSLTLREVFEKGTPHAGVFLNECKCRLEILEYDYDNILEEVEPGVPGQAISVEDAMSFKDNFEVIVYCEGEDPFAIYFKDWNELIEWSKNAGIDLDSEKVKRIKIKKSIKIRR